MVSVSGDMLPLGQSINISDTGMLIETKERPALNSILNVALVWGDDTFASCVRVTRHDPTGIGVAFLDVTPELHSFLEQAGDRRPKKPRTR